MTITKTADVEGTLQQIYALAAAGCAVLLVTHDLFGACQVADRIALLRDGRLQGEFQAAAGERIELARVLQSFNNMKAA